MQRALFNISEQLRKWMEINGSMQSVKPNPEMQVKTLYMTNFDPNDYCAAYYAELDPEVEFFLRNYYQLFKEESSLSAVPRPLTVFELGCGPVPIYAATFGASLQGGKITMAEMLQKNRDALQQWIQNPEADMRWEEYFKYIETISDVSHQNVEKLTKQLISDVVNIDLCQDVKNCNQKYNVVMTTLCLEFAASSLAEYETMVYRASNYVRYGGLLLMAGALGNSYYMLAGIKYPSVNLNEDQIRTALAAAKMDVICLNTMLRQTDQQAKPTDHSGVFFVAAKKN